MDLFHCIRCGKWYLLLYGEATARECYPLIRNGFLAGRVLFSNNVAIDGVHTIVPLLKRNDYEKNTCQTNGLRCCNHCICIL